MIFSVSQKLDGSLRKCFQVYDILHKSQQNIRNFSLNQPKRIVSGSQLSKYRDASKTVARRKVTAY